MIENHYGMLKYSNLFERFEKEHKNTGVFISRFQDLFQKKQKKMNKTHKEKRMRFLEKRMRFLEKRMRFFLCVILFFFLPENQRFVIASLSKFIFG